MRQAFVLLLLFLLLGHAEKVAARSNVKQLQYNGHKAFQPSAIKRLFPWQLVPNASSAGKRGKQR